MNTENCQFERREGNLLVSLTKDAYDYNDRLFSLEVSALDGAEWLDTDADVSGLEVDATPVEVNAYLDAAFASVRKNAGDELNVRLTAHRAAQAGMEAVRTLREASCR
jgi:hypothetical protein